MYCLLMSTKGLKWTVILFLITEGFVRRAVCFNLNIERPSYGYRNGYEVYHRSAESTTECASSTAAAEAASSTPAAGGAEKGGEASGGGSSTEAPGGAPATGGPPPAAPPAAGGHQGPAPSGGAVTSSPANVYSSSALKLHELVQHIYAAQARVQMEANEIKKAQGVATAAQKSLEEAANNVRVITAALQTAQQEVAAAAVRAQTAQLQLAAHDQLLFAARQKVDALSAQMVGLQAEDSVGAPRSVVNIPALLAQLKEPLPQSQTPTPIPQVDAPCKGEASSPAPPPAQSSAPPAAPQGFLEYDDYYIEV